MPFITVPSAMVGGVLAVFATRESLLLGSLLGFLLLFEIVVRDSNVMIEQFYRLERREGVPFAPELILRGADECLSSITATALAIALILVPSLILGDISGLEIICPMDRSVGMPSNNNIFNLFVLLTPYLRYGTSRKVELEFQPTGGVDAPVAADD